jgi:hypothetical protein
MTAAEPEPPAEPTGPSTTVAIAWAAFTTTTYATCAPTLDRRRSTMQAPERLTPP